MAPDDPHAAMVMSAASADIAAHALPAMDTTRCCAMLLSFHCDTDAVLPLIADPVSAMLEQRCDGASLVFFDDVSIVYDYC
jgi:hypothetical protein